MTSCTLCLKACCDDLLSLRRAKDFNDSALVISTRDIISQTARLRYCFSGYTHAYLIKHGYQPDIRDFAQERTTLKGL